MNSVDDDTIMITVFGKRTTVGLVRFYSGGAAKKVADLLKSLQGKTPEISFAASDIVSSDIFADGGAPVG
jgi:hypothetical protein